MLSIEESLPAYRPFVNIFKHHFASYKVNPSGQKVDLPKNLHPMHLLGTGAYGTVLACAECDPNEPKNLTKAFKEKGDDLENVKMYAVKKFINTFTHSAYCRRTLREIRLLRVLQHENIVSLISVFLSPPENNNYIANEVYAVTGVMDTDMTYIIYSNQQLSTNHIIFFIYQLLRALIYIHSAGVIHRDLKPRNVLVNKDCLIKVCDFGLARFENEIIGLEDDTPMTEYVCTRWYRPPEVLCCADKGYTTKADMWSLGCIICELFNRETLFRGKSTLDQLTRICDLIGSPKSNEELFSFTNDKARKFILERLSNMPGKGLARKWKQMKKADDEMCGLVDSLVSFNPIDRMSAKDVLESCSFLEELRDPADEPVLTKKDLELFRAEFEFERREVDLYALCEEVYDEAYRCLTPEDKEFVSNEEIITAKKLSKINKNEKVGHHDILDYPLLSSAVTVTSKTDTFVDEEWDEMVEDERFPIFGFKKVKL